MHDWFRDLHVNQRSSINNGFGRALRRWSLIGLAVVALTASGLGVDQGALAKGKSASQTWVGTWATSPQIPSTEFPETFDNQTLRQIVHTSIGGSELRVRFSNSFGIESLTIDAASIGIHDEDGSVVPGTLMELTFGGEPSITIPTGGRVLSDPVNLAFEPEQDLAISLYVAEESDAWTIHRVALQTAYVSPPGDYTASETMPVGTTTSIMSYWLTGVDVVAHRSTQVVATYGDSITDGTRSTVDANARWPNELARRLNERRNGAQKVGVLDEGISGNRILHDIRGQNALARLDRDVLTQTGVTHVILLEGINDIGFSQIAAYADQEVSAEEIIAGYKQIIERAHARGVKIYGGTLLPFKGAGYYSDDGEAKRQAVNDFIRNSGEFDAVIDFDKLMRDPDHPLELLPAYNSGDNLHPNDEGYKAMGDFVDLNLFKQGGPPN
jgi:lysophospholipase L1-like esterase